jgi:hypothetical protein
LELIGRVFLSTEPLERDALRRSPIPTAISFS